MTLLPQTYRENFGIPDPLKIVSGAGKSVGNAAGTTANAAGSAANKAVDTGKSVGNKAVDAGKSVGNKITSKVLGPIADFFKKIWGWFKWVLSACCCVCIIGCCVVLGIPQMIVSAIN